MRESRALAAPQQAPSLPLAPVASMDAPTAASPVPPMDKHEVLVLAVFLGVYLGMALGRWPASAIDRTGTPLSAAFLLLFFDAETGASAAGIDTGTQIGRPHVGTPATIAQP